MVTETYSRYQSQITEAHRRYLTVRDDQYAAYAGYCEAGREERDGEIARVDPQDRERIQAIRTEYDTKVRRQAHISQGYESRAWVDYRRESDRINLEYGMDVDRIKDIRAIMEKALGGG